MMGRFSKVIRTNAAAGKSCLRLGNSVYTGLTIAVENVLPFRPQCIGRK